MSGSWIRYLLTLERSDCERPPASPIPQAGTYPGIESPKQITEDLAARSHIGLQECGPKRVHRTFRERYLRTPSGRPETNGTLCRASEPSRVTRQFRLGTEHRGATNSAITGHGGPLHARLSVEDLQRRGRGSPPLYLSPTAWLASPRFCGYHQRRREAIFPK